MNTHWGKFTNYYGLEQEIYECIFPGANSLKNKPWMRLRQKDKK